VTLISWKSKLSPKCVKIARPTLFGYIETREEFEYYVNELFSMLKSGQLKVKVHKVYPLEQIAQAHIVRIHRVLLF
jgi:NADPH2:quinone reductase